MINSDEESRFYICPICKKSFYIPVWMSLPDYAYCLRTQSKKKKTVDTTYCCSWKCFSKLKYGNEKK